MQDASTGDADRHAQVVTEVADRLLAIGRLGDHVAAGEVAPRDAVRTAEELLGMARTWVL